MELFRQLDNGQTDGLTELFLKSLSRLKMDFWPNLELPDLAEHGRGLPQDPPTISCFSGQLIKIKIGFQPGVTSNPLSLV